MFPVSNEPYITTYFKSEKPLNTEPLFLSVLVTPNSFMYAISTNNFKNVVELCHVELVHLTNTVFNLTEKVSFLIHNYLLPRKKYEKINASFLNSTFTLSPGSFIKDSDTKALLQFTTGTELTRGYSLHRLKDFNFYYAIDGELTDLFEKTFPNVSIKHAGAVGIDLFFSQHSLADKDLFLNIGDKHIELTGKKNNRLLFYNVFHVDSNEDILYYLLFTMEQFQLNPLYTRLSISGEQSATDALIIKNIKKYIKQVSFCVTDASVNLTGELSTLPKHYYFALLNQHLCVL